LDSNACRAGEVERKVWRDNDSLLRGELLKTPPLVVDQSAVSTQRKRGQPRRSLGLLGVPGKRPCQCYAERGDAIRPIERFGWTFCAGDKVMQIENDYDKEVYNGDLGDVSRIDLEEGELAVDFEGREVIYGFGELDELVPAYATTIHKSRGSEYPAVVIPLTTMLQRNPVYTGVTDGKRLVVLAGQRKALTTANKGGRRDGDGGGHSRIPYGSAAWGGGNWQHPSGGVSHGGFGSKRWGRQQSTGRHPRKRRSTRLRERRSSGRRRWSSGCRPRRRLSGRR
jgi:exodeoxyribonuclease V alpha subunit